MSRTDRRSRRDRHRMLLLCALLGGAPSCSTSGGSLYAVAARGDSRQRAVELIEAGADVNAVNADTGWTPLHAAAANGHPKMCVTLLEHGANVNAQDHNGMTPLHLARSIGHDGTVGVLLSAGADSSIRNTSGQTPGEMASD